MVRSALHHRITALAFSLQLYGLLSLLPHGSLAAFLFVRVDRRSIDDIIINQSINNSTYITNKSVRPRRAQKRSIEQQNPQGGQGQGWLGLYHATNKKRKKGFGSGFPVSEGASPRVFWYSGRDFNLRASREAVRATEQAEREAQASSALARKQSGEASSASKQAVSQSVSQCISASPSYINNHQP